jgi:hypothetical protein
MELVIGALVCVIIGLIWYTNRPSTYPELTDFKPEPKPKPNKSKFYIDYYPESGRYYPMYNGGFLKKHYDTGIVDVRYEDWYIIYADYGPTERGAMKYITLYKEQQLKENVKRIAVD